jgi:uncharacterized membrane protein
MPASYHHFIQEQQGMMMDFSPIENASNAIQMHIIFAMVAIILFLSILWVRRGGKAHRIMGRLWVCTMIATALSSFWIHTIDHFWGFSAIHLLSVYTLISCATGVIAIQRGNVTAHRKAMMNTALGGLFIAGAFSFMPGRIMHHVLVANLP